MNNRPNGLHAVTLITCLGSPNPPSSPDSFTNRVTLTAVESGNILQTLRNLTKTN